MSLWRNDSRKEKELFVAELQNWGSRDVFHATDEYIYLY